MLSTERKLYLLQKVEREGTIHVRDVAKQLNISETTIRRDLMELEQEGKVRRVHGGAVRESLNQILTESRELLMQDRMLINFDRKSRICRSASELVEDGECVFLDGGTSIVAMIDYLQSRPIKIVPAKMCSASRQFLLLRFWHCSLLMYIIPYSGGIRQIETQPAETGFLFPSITYTA